MERTDESQTGLGQLADFAAHLDLSAVDPSDVLHMKYDLLDSVGCALYGSTTPWARIVQRYATKVGGTKDAAIWGTKLRWTCGSATLANGTAAQSLELDNSHTPLGLHLGCSIVPAAIAVAERQDSTGRELLEALTVGYEVAIRIRGAMDISHILKGFNSTGTCSGFGAAAAAGRLLGLDAERICNAMGIVGTYSVGLQSAQFSMAKRLLGPRIAEGGLLAAFLAEDGYTGTPNLLEAELGGFFRSLSDVYDPARVTAGLGKELRVKGMGIKPYPSSHGTHAALDAGKALREKYGINPQQIREITVSLPPHAAKTKVGWKATDIPSALHDVRFTLAVMLLKGDFFVEHVRDEVFADPAVQRLMELIKIVPEPAFGDSLETRWTGQVKIRMSDGKVLESDVIWHPKGTPANPVTPDEIAQKFMKLAAPILGEKRGDAIREYIVNLDSDSGVRGLTELMRA
ncbi:MAG: MmgE/PrpD family protein [Candidatus Bipolaricaulia bacterium]